MLVLLAFVSMVCAQCLPLAQLTRPPHVRPFTTRLRKVDEHRLTPVDTLNHFAQIILRFHNSVSVMIVLGLMYIVQKILSRRLYLNIADEALPILMLFTQLHAAQDTLLEVQTVCLTGRDERLARVTGTLTRAGLLPRMPRVVQE